MPRNDTVVTEASASQVQDEELQVSDTEPTTESQAETPDSTPEETETPTTEVSLEAQISAATAFLQTQGFSVRKASAATRQLMVKAEPSEVKAYFDRFAGEKPEGGVVLTRKELADAVGVTVSVIATVQNENGDRWSAIRFAAAKRLIEAYAEAKAETLLALALENAEASETEPAGE